MFKNIKINDGTRQNFCESVFESFFPTSNDSTQKVSLESACDIPTIPFLTGRKRPCTRMIRAWKTIKQLLLDPLAQGEPVFILGFMTLTFLAFVELLKFFKSPRPSFVTAASITQRTALLSLIIMVGFCLVPAKAAQQNYYFCDKPTQEQYCGIAVNIGYGLPKTYYYGHGSVEKLYEKIYTKG